MAQVSNSWTGGIGQGRNFIERFEAAAQEDGRNAIALRDLLWRLNIHPELPGLVQVCRHIQEILALLPECLNTNAEAIKFAEWLPILAWISRDPNQLARRIFPEGTPEGKWLRCRFLESHKNPIVNAEATRHGLHCLLWASHWNDELQRRFRILQAHVLVAYSAVMHHETVFEDWAAGKEPHKGFYVSIYRPGLLVRRFTELGQVWTTTLQKIPLRSTFNDMPDQLRTIASEIAANWSEQCGESDAIKKEVSRASGSVRGIAGFLNRGLDPAGYVKRTHQNTRGHGKGGGKSKGGAGDTGALTDAHLFEVADVEMVCGDPDDPDESPVTLHLPVRWQRKPKQYERLILAGDHPGEELSSQGIQVAENEAGVALATGGAVEMANQLLPWSYRDLSSSELSAFLAALQAFTTAWPSQVLELSALLNTMLWTGASLDQALSLYVLVDETPEPDCDLALRIGNIPDNDTSIVAEWRVRVLPLPVKAEGVSPVERARERSPYFTLHDKVQGSVMIQRFVDYLRSRVREPLAQHEAIVKRPLRIFTREAVWYRAELKRLFQEVDCVGRITANRISRVMFQTIVEQTGGDIVAAALITQTDHALASVRRYYATPEIGHLQRTYDDATRSLQTGLAVNGLARDALEARDVERSGVAVGSPLCPTVAAVQEAVQILKSKINAPFDHQNILERHNIFTLYSVWTLGFATGIRGVRIPYLYSGAVDQDSGFATLTDKDSGNGYKSRLVWLPVPVRQQMKHYEAWLSELPAVFKCPSVTRKMPCYFLDENGRPEAVRPKTMTPFLRRYLNFPANVARHFISTELRERGFPPEMLDAWLGHWWRGEEPWGPHSSFCFLDYRRELENVLVPFLAELGFEPLTGHSKELQ